MGDRSHIEWTDATKTCRTCHESKPLTAFANDKSRADGHTYVCRQCRNARARSSYHPKARPMPGRTFVPARDGDVRQARRRVNYLVETGLIPPANSLPCTECGHLWALGERRHEYDHHLGYDAEHHEHVEAVCTTCHHRRETERRKAAA